MAKTSNSSLSKLWAGLENAMYFPKIMIIGIPMLIFVSLFFVPESFIGLTKSSKTMESSYRNKWLFDIIYISTILLFINLHMSIFFKKNTGTAFENINDTSKFNGNPAYIKSIFYLIFFIYCLSMNIDSSNSTRFLMEYKRSAYINFFIYIVLFYYMTMILGSVVLSIKGDGNELQ